ncbi:hypothetical protein CC1G_15781 [Coprinopsis cinerea okayama7|uniref:Uncharacterized protein n=1 Tax=Coprinopsis cinerea (strain Okayama-7 / 130 / ATCC MYA-4618 / FGSC 9003) TaxID=240176 RepID=D6RR24_COPC7|nr:hypothetical protein CC1G_15781 [Coprinopsis cinerea okayama7\|eukprot:XP_002910061.1 hypothetical protein CC1G_15781 [Coprinopsis cinerea okayama7\
MSLITPQVMFVFLCCIAHGLIQFTALSPRPEPPPHETDPKYGPKFGGNAMESPMELKGMLRSKGLDSRSHRNDSPTGKLGRGVRALDLPMKARQT